MAAMAALSSLMLNPNTPNGQMLMMGFNNPLIAAAAAAQQQQQQHQQQQQQQQAAVAAAAAAAVGANGDVYSIDSIGKAQPPVFSTQPSNGGGVSATGYPFGDGQQVG